MARKISTGTVGDPILGVLKITDTTFTPINNNTSIVLTPTGTGVIEANTDVSFKAGNSALFYDADGSNYVNVSAPALSSNITFTLPNSNGSNGQVLQTNGSGVLSWVENGVVEISNTSVPTTEQNLAWVDTTSTSNGSLTTLSVTSAKLTFKPSDGTVRFKGNQTSSSTTTGTLIVTGGVGVSGQVTCTDLSAGSITETSSITYKENVNPITNALNSILQLTGVTYDRKNSVKKGEAGLIAEEVAPIIPNVVAYKDGKPDGINYTKLSAYLIEAIKELKEELDRIKK